MNYAQIKQRYLCVVDLHANSMYLKILDREGQVIYKRNMPNNFALFKQILTPFLPDLAVGAESTFNYYWLYDGCVEADIPFYLGHAAYMKAIAGNKQKKRRAYKSFLSQFPGGKLTLTSFLGCSISFPTANVHRVRSHL